ncbi:MAG TPA: hypothetical protein VI357_06590 [Mycobacteriales bacterium]
MGTRLRFEGWIAGVGTASGTRIVLGHWPHSPYGAFSDVMVQRADGHRLLLAPRPEIAGFVASTYTFDEVRVVDVAVTRDRDTWTVAAGPLRLRFRTGRRPALGLLLRAVPPPLARTRAWTALLDRPAHLLTGLHTTGSAGHDRTEHYGVQDLRRIVAATATWAEDPLGPLTEIDPPVTFGFGSVPAEPSLAQVTTTVTNR